MAYTPVDLASTAGIPGQWSEDLTVLGEGFIVGDTPAVVTVDMLFAASMDIPARTPVGLNAAGELVPALVGSVDPDDDIKPIGFTVIAVKTGATGAKKAAPVYRAGVFNPALANWPASFTTDALKMGAFEGAPSPTQIVLRPVKTATPILP